MRKVFILIMAIVMLSVMFISCNESTGDISVPGEKGEKGDKGDKGDAGVSIINTAIIDGELWITYSNAPDTSVNLGKVVGDNGAQGEKGDTGAQGPQGEKGDTGERGPQGEKGDTGVSIINVEVIDCELWITYSDAPDNPVKVGKCCNCETKNLPLSTEGLEFKLNDDGRGYTVVGIGTCTKPNIVIGAYNDLPVTRVEKNAFFNCGNVESVVLGNSITSIGAYAFGQCYSLATVSMGNGVTDIELGAFVYCENLTEIALSDSLVNIGEVAFSGCSSLSSVTLPDSVASIGMETFRDCTSLANITLGNNINSIGWFAFKGCASLTDLTIPTRATLPSLHPQNNYCTL